MENELILKRYVNHMAPFGPIDAGAIDVTHQAIRKDLFDPQNKIYDALQLNPSIIIGRRGSGKTAYLHSVFTDHGFGIVQEIKTSKLFSRIVSTIEKNTPSFVLTEDVSELWNDLFYFSVMSEVAHQYGSESRELNLIKDYIAKNSLRSKGSMDSFLWKVVNSLGESSGENFVGAVAKLVKTITGISFEEAKQITIKVLNDKQQRAILLLDSLEQYPTSIQSVAHALSGLLMCIGQFNERNERVSVRLCLPAELYHVFLDLVSANPMKDLEKPLTLHWIAGELLSVAAHRLILYLKLYFPYEFRRLGSFDLSRRENVQALLLRYLPAQITNGFGVTEGTLAYLLRHTQLQPRHLLLYLNAIFSKQRELNNTDYPRITQTAVKESIASIEHRLCQEVFSGYKTLYPTARTVCEVCIPELPFCFSHSVLQKVFTRYGRKASEFTDFWDFRRLLIETGIVGRVIDETERYIIGRFEYTEPHKLVVSTEANLCLHPVFAEVFNFKKQAGKRTVYPYGCDPDSEDHRRWTFRD